MPRSSSAVTTPFVVTSRYLASQTPAHRDFLTECHDDLARCLAVPVYDIDERRRKTLNLVYKLTRTKHLAPFNALYQQILFRYQEQALRAMLFALRVFYGIRAEELVWMKHAAYTDDDEIQVERPRPQTKNVRDMTEADKKELRRWLVLSHLDMLNNKTIIVFVADLAIKFGYSGGHRVTMHCGGTIKVPAVEMDDDWRREMMQHALSALIALATMMSHNADGSHVKLEKTVIKCGCAFCCTGEKETKDAGD